MNYSEYVKECSLVEGVPNIEFNNLSISVYTTISSCYEYMLDNIKNSMSEASIKLKSVVGDSELLMSLFESGNDEKEVSSDDNDIEGLFEQDEAEYSVVKQVLNSNENEAEDIDSMFESDEESRNSEYEDEDSVETNNEKELDLSEVFDEEYEYEEGLESEEEINFKEEMELEEEPEFEDEEPEFEDEEPEFEDEEPESENEPDFDEMFEEETELEECTESEEEPIFEEDTVSEFEDSSFDENVNNQSEGEESIDNIFEDEDYSDKDYDFLEAFYGSNSGELVDNKTTMGTYTSTSQGVAQNSTGLNIQSRLEDSDLRMAETLMSAVNKVGKFGRKKYFTLKGKLADDKI